jgi:uncharacterized protein (TIRG00374 family)
LLVVLGLSSVRSSARWERFRMVHLLHQVCEAVVACQRQPRLLAGSTALLATYHIVGILPVYLLLGGLGLDAPLGQVVALGLLVRLAGFLPVSVSGLGINEAGFVLALAQIGVGASDALAIAIVDRLIQLVLPILGGLIFAVGGMDGTVTRGRWRRPVEGRAGS